MKRGRDAIKRALDRRYLTKADAAALDVSEMASRLAALEIEVSSIRSSVSALESATKQLNANVEDVTRLTGECAQAIERLLQDELLLRRDLDAVSRDRPWRSDHGTV